MIWACATRGKASLTWRSSISSKAVELQPDRELYRNNIATVLVEVGRSDEAVRQIAAVYGEPIAHYNVGVLLQQQGKRQDGRPTIRQRP